MMKAKWLFWVLLSVMFTARIGHAQTIKTSVQKTERGWALVRNGEPYYVKGIGGSHDMDKAAAIGANSVRTWGADDALGILDEAQRRGMTVMLGIWLETERGGFDYNDAAAVHKQIERAKAQIDRYKDHPALLAWGIGNELDLKSHNPKAWDTVEELAKYLHSVDPNHPTMTVIAGIHRDVVEKIKRRIPDLDILGVNVYGAIYKADHQLDAYGWHRPYIITEWGADGFWEVKKTRWGAAIEQNSTEKRDAIERHYLHNILANRERCLGSYAFLWGWKQEYTSTWFGLLLKDGTPTEPVDALESAFTGKRSVEPSPTLIDVRLDGKQARDNIRLASGHGYPIDVVAQLPAWARSAGRNPPITYAWTVLYESTDKKDGGDSELEAQELANAIDEPAQARAVLRAPEQAGAYRLFVTVRANGKAAYANIPFFVDGPATKKDNNRE